MHMLVDGNNLAYRNYAAQSDLRTSKGEGTGAIYGTLKSLHLLKKVYRPARMFVFWDIGSSTWRKKLYPAYKANRDTQDQEKAIYLEEYRRQLLEVRKAINMLGVSQIHVAGVEADDLIGIAVSRLESMPVHGVVIVSSDADFNQLLRPGVKILRSDGSDYVERTAQGFVMKYGFDPVYWPDVRALMGDASDNIPGIKGIGEKRAAAIVRTFGGLSTILNARRTGTFLDKYVDDVKQHADEARLYRLLSAIPTVSSATYYDGETRLSIKYEIMKLVRPELLLLKQEFAEFCREKELSSISKDHNEWLYTFGGNRILKGDR